MKCTHGATIGQLNDESIYYLRSRGIGLETARRMLIHAFAGEIIDRVKHDALREELDALVWDRLRKQHHEPWPCYPWEMTLEKLISNFELLGDWEERYGYLIDLGKKLPGLPDEREDRGQPRPRLSGDGVAGDGAGPGTYRRAPHPRR